MSGGRAVMAVEGDCVEALEEQLVLDNSTNQEGAGGLY